MSDLVWADKDVDDDDEIRECFMGLCVFGAAGSSIDIDIFGRVCVGVRACACVWL